MLRKTDTAMESLRTADQSFLAGIGEPREPSRLHAFVQQAVVRLEDQQMFLDHLLRVSRDVQYDKLPVSLTKLPVLSIKAGHRLIPIFLSIPLQIYFVHRKHDCRIIQQIPLTRVIPVFSRIVYWSHAWANRAEDYIYKPIQLASLWVAFDSSIIPDFGIFLAVGLPLLKPV